MGREYDTAAFLAMAVFWGLNYPMLKIAFAYEPPLFVLLFRVIFALGGALVVFRKQLVFPKGRRENAVLFLISSFNITLFMGLWFIGEESVSAALSSILVYSYPLFNVLGSAIFLGDRPPGISIAGLILGFIGLIIISGSNFTSAYSAGIVLLLGSAVCWAAGTIIFKKYAKGMGVATVNVFQYVYALPVLLIVSLIFEGNAISSPGLPFLSVTAYIGILGTAIAYFIYLHLFRNYSVSSISSFFFAVPAISIVLSSLILSENLSMITYGGFAVISLGIFLSSRR
ncbi:MAG: DMT family transporter [Candidatus Thermoplasmatota archaeon]|nr:DMT family transporter [Candidatus Thermoplasmatota archaeon]MCL5800169.1 DMT family transporter [Candidatus Thermoplasmatota archaeon]